MCKGVSEDMLTDVEESFQDIMNIFSQSFQQKKKEY